MAFHFDKHCYPTNCYPSRHGNVTCFVGESNAPSVVNVGMACYWIYPAAGGYTALAMVLCGYRMTTCPDLSVLNSGGLIRCRLLLFLAPYSKVTYCTGHCCPVFSHSTPHVGWYAGDSRIWAHSYCCTCRKLPRITASAWCLKCVNGGKSMVKYFTEVEVLLAQWHVIEIEVTLQYLSRKWLKSKIKIFKNCVPKLSPIN